MGIFGTKERDGGTAVAEPDFPQDELFDEGEGEGKKKKKRRSERKSKPAKVLPSLSTLSMVRRIEGDVIEDFAGQRFAVWSVAGCDSTSAQVINGWLLMLNSIEYPVQILIRQHAPDMSGVRQEFLSVRPAHMKEGRINDVGNSMLDYLREMEEGGRVVSRKWYVVASEAKAMELQSVMLQSGFKAERMGEEELALLLQASVSGMGYGYTRDLYQAQETSTYLELNERYMSVYEVNRWPRRVSLLFLEQLLRTGEEMDISVVVQRFGHSN